MKITNNYGLPNAFVKYAKESTSYEPKPNRFGATSLLLPAEEIVLRRRYRNWFHQDVSDMINMFIGHAIHEKLERLSDDEKAEYKLTYTFDDGYTVSGVIDLFDNKILIDYKTAKVNTIVYENYTDWKLQGLIYAWLARKNGVVIDNVLFYAILKDWSAYGKENARKNDNFYPEAPIVPVSFKVNSDDILKIEKYIVKKINKIKQLELLDAEFIVKSKLEERFRPKKRYAIYKPNGKRAYRVVDTRDEAERIALKDWRIEERIEPNMDYEMKCFALKHVKNILKGS